jgi:hypothetical protein
MDFEPQTDLAQGPARRMAAEFPSSLSVRALLLLSPSSLSLLFLLFLLLLPNPVGLLLTPE